MEVVSTPTSTTVSFGLTTGCYASVFLRELVGPRLVDRFFDAPPTDTGDIGGGDAVAPSPTA
jgi:hypothetical protein